MLIASGYKEMELPIEKNPDNEKDILPVSACTADFDERSVLATFLADMIEKCAEILILEIENEQIPVDERIAA